MSPSVSPWPLRYFKRSEFEFPEEMHPLFLKQLDEFRSQTQTRFILTADFAKKGHAAHSMHYEGRAVDGHFVNLRGQRLPLVDQFLLAIKSTFNGIGLYSFGAPFIHLDNRESPERKIWVAEHEGVYRNLDRIFLRKIAGEI